MSRERPWQGIFSGAWHAIDTCLHTSPLPDTLKYKSIKVMDSPAEVAAACDTIIVMVPDTPDVTRLIRGDNGLLECLRDRAPVIYMRSISPIVTAELARLVEAKGGQCLDAPASGGKVGAKARTLAIMVNGPQQAFDRPLPLLRKHPAWAAVRRLGVAPQVASSRQAGPVPASRPFQASG